MTAYRHFGGAIQRQDVSGGDWTPLDRDEANELLAGVTPPAGAATAEDLDRECLEWVLGAAKAALEAQRAADGRRAAILQAVVDVIEEELGLQPQEAAAS